MLFLIPLVHCEGELAYLVPTMVFLQSTIAVALCTLGENWPTAKPIAIAMCTAPCKCPPSQPLMQNLYASTVNLNQMHGDKTKVQHKGVTTVPHTIPKVCTTESCRMEEPRKNTNIKYISFGNTTKCMCMKRPALNRYMYTNIIWVLLHNVYTVFQNKRMFR